jgi:hypothetical protein
MEDYSLYAILKVWCFDEKGRGLDHVKRASYYKAQIWNDFRAVRGVFTAITGSVQMKGSY